MSQVHTTDHINSVVVKAPRAGIKVGEGVAVGNIVGVSANLVINNEKYLAAVELNDDIVIFTMGVVSLEKSDATDVIAAGDAVYMNTTTGKIEATSGAGNVFAGVATKASGNGTAKAEFALKGLGIAG